MAPVGQDAMVVGISHRWRSLLVGHFGRRAVDPQDGDVGAVHRAAHVEAAGQGDAHLGRQLVAAEVLEQVVHDGLDDARGVDGRGMAMDPALGVNDAGHRVAGAADGDAHLFAGVLQAGDLALVGEQELDVVPGSEAQVAIAEFVGQAAHIFDEVGGHQAAGATPDGKDLGAGFGHVHQHTGLQDFVVFPLAVVVFDDGRQELVKFWGANISYTVSHFPHSSL